MARLGPKERAALPDRAFAYVDAKGQRRLPIHDAAHVRNALARFGRVAFEDDETRDRALRKLLNAAKRFKIVPVGFIATQLQVERAIGQRGGAAPSLPSGFVTMLMTDVEGSTGLVQRHGDHYGAVIDELWAVLRAGISEHGGHEVEARADEFFAVFEAPRAAVDAAIESQVRIARRDWPDGADVRVRFGIHSGYPTSTTSNYVGIDVNTTSRLCAAGHGGQILVSAATREAVKASEPTGVRFVALGRHRLRGLPEPVPLFQVAGRGLTPRFPPLRVPATDRPATGS